MVKPNFEDWYEANDAELKLDYMAYLVVNDVDKLVDAVFGESNEAKDGFGAWVNRQFEVYCDEGGDYERD